MFRVDLHTHSVASPDGSLGIEDYRRMLDSGRLGVIAITDHDTVALAQEARRKLGDRIVVGEEVSTAQGEIIGLYLREAVEPGRPALATARAIHDQGGLVYVPHPFETVRRGVTQAVLEEITAEADIIETHNGRAWWQDRGGQARQWAAGHQMAQAASSDAHGRVGWGRTASEVTDAPERETLVPLLQKAHFITGKVGWPGLLYPKFNRLRRQVR